MRALLCLLCTLVPAAAAAVPVTFDLRGEFEFISDAPLEKIRGTAEAPAIVVTTDLADLTRTTGTVAVETASIKTGSPTRDQHLLGDDWLDAKGHPQMRFRITSVAVATQEQRGELHVAKGVVQGLFTLRGTARPVTARFLLKRKADRVKVTLRFALRLSDFSIRGQQGVIGKKVGESIEIRGTLRGRARRG